MLKWKRGDILCDDFTSINEVGLVIRTTLSWSAPFEVLHELASFSNMEKIEFQEESAFSDESSRLE